MSGIDRDSVEREIRSAVMRERRSAEATLGKLLAALPLNRIVSAGATVSDLADGIRKVVTERDTLLARAEAAEGVLASAGICEIAARNPSVMEYMRHWEGRVEAAEARAKAAEERLAEVDSDADRLDYLDTCNTGFNHRNGTRYGWKLDWNHNRIALTDHNLPPLTVREAIDASRLKAPPNIRAALTDKGDTDNDR